MPAQFHSKIANGSLIIYGVLLMLSPLLLASAGTMVPIYVFMGILGVIPIFLGKRWIRVVGVAAFLLATTLATHDYLAGQDLQKRVRAVVEQSRTLSSQSATTTQGN